MDLTRREDGSRMGAWKSYIRFGWFRDTIANDIQSYLQGHEGAMRSQLFAVVHRRLRSYGKVRLSCIKRFALPSYDTEALQGQLAVMALHEARNWDGLLLMYVSSKQSRFNHLAISELSSH